MTIDPETLMAYADGELDPLAAKRVERAVAADPSLARQIEQHRALRAQVSGAFAPTVEEPVPDRLAALLRSNVVPLPQSRTNAVKPRWRAGAALAACLALGVSLGLGWHGGGSVTTRGDGMYASGKLATALDTQIAATGGAVRVALSFRDHAGRYCRVFASPETDGIACHDAAGWALRQTRSGHAGGAAGKASEYRQAGSVDADLMAAAQNSMAGDPLSPADEARARAAGWR